MSITKPQWIYRGLVLKVVDGDTYDIRCDTGFGGTMTQRFRLHGVDTPETWRPANESERTHGEAATAFVKNLIEEKTVIVKTYKLSVYGRYEAEVWTMSDDGEPLESIADLLAANGLLKKADYSTGWESI